MKVITTTIKTLFQTRPANALLLMLTGFLFSLVMLANFLHTKHPHGGWDTSVGVFTTSSILITLLVALSMCLFGLWRSTETEVKSETQGAIPQS